jgi:predicted membrane-bound spermidine synthase
LGIRKTLEARPHLRLFALSFLALFLELTIIRWVPGSIKLVAYYANLMLISSFLGLGLGSMLAERGARGLARWFPVLLAMDVAFLVLARQVLLPGSPVELRFYSLHAVGLASYVVLVGIFVLNAAVFVPLGEEIGQQFRRLDSLRGYAWDLGGSLAGTLAFGIFAVLHFSPQLGLAIGVILFALLFPAEALNVRTVILFVILLVVSVATTEWRATWSAYNHLSIRAQSESTWTLLSRAPTPPSDLIAMRDPPTYLLSVNQNFYQYHRSIDIRRFTPGTVAYQATDSFRLRYLIPYEFTAAPKRVAVVGSGGGLDIEAALVHGAERVDAVEIDPAIVGLARRYSAGGAYEDPRTSIHVDDARAFFEANPGDYDLVVFGLLDSQGLFNAMANIRLDGFVYTVEGVRAAWRLLNDGGVLSLGFGAAGRDWLGGKLYRMVAEATGREPRVYVNTGRSNFIVVVEKQPRDDPPDAIGPFVRWHPTAEQLRDPPATDDWPYLYLRRRTVPSDYLVVMVSLLVLSVGAVLLVKPAGTATEGLHFGALGAGFLLLETKAIVDSSLYFGATWLVSMIVISGVLVMILAANAVTRRFITFSRWLYAPLIASVLLIYATPHHLVLALPFWTRVAWTALAVPLPIFFAGLVFSSTFRRTPHPPAAFGANLVGAMLGGFAEYLGMALGSRSLVLIIVAAYLVSLLAVSRTERRVARVGAPAT